MDREYIPIAIAVVVIVLILVFLIMRRRRPRTNPVFPIPPILPSPPSGQPVPPPGNLPPGNEPPVDIGDLAYKIAYERTPFADSKLPNDISNWYPPFSELLATNLMQWKFPNITPVGGGTPITPGATPPTASGPVNPANLIEYFKLIWPEMPNQDPNILQQVYLNLDCWYMDFIPQLKPNVSNAMYANDRYTFLTDIDKNANIEFARLFDGNVCDCLRLSHKVCVYSPDRLTKNALTACPEWPFLKINVTNAWLLRRAFDSDNPDTNYRKDKIIRANVSGRKGFPNWAYYEGLVFPGEYGIPDLCTSESNLDPYWKENQKGIKTKSGKELLISNRSEPWFNNVDCETLPCAKGYTCTSVVSDGSYGPEGTFQRCLRDNTYKETFTDSYSKEYFTARFEPDCPGKGFPDTICPLVQPEEFRGFWTYPLVGCGMWFTVGNSVVANTKLGFLLTPQNEGGCGFDLERLMEIRGDTNFIAQNIVQQVKRVAAILKNGQVKANYNWPEMTIDELKKHGYKGDKIASDDESLQAAKDLVTMWYVEGYSGLENGIPNGFNYNYKKYFPIGTHFAYASKFDDLILSWLAYKNLDSIQLLVEPQNAAVGLRPAYMFEVFAKKPTTEAAMADSAFKDITITQCRACFTLDPSSYLANFIKYGYIPKSHAPEKPKVINPAAMKARASVKSFTPV